MKVRCAICGFEADVIVWQDWYRSPASMPDIWICDIHPGEYVASSVEDYDPDEV